MVDKYECLASQLLEWIEQTIIILNNRKFANSLVGVQQQLQAFNTYRTVEKPPKCVAFLGLPDNSIRAEYFGVKSLTTRMLKIVLSTLLTFKKSSFLIFMCFNS